MNNYKYYTHHIQKAICGWLPDFICSFNKNQNDLCLEKSFVHNNFDIEINNYPKVQYNYPISLLDSLKYDEDGIPLLFYNNEYIYHAVFIIQRGIALMQEYSKTQQVDLLNRAENFILKLIALSNNSEDVALIPYENKHKLHRIPFEVMKPTWYSGMAQGQFLSFASLLYINTKNDKYLKLSEQIFKSLALIKAENEIWVSCIDRNKNLWIEEYPMEYPNFTLNGFIFAIFGLYDYAHINNSDEVLRYLKGTLTTVYNNIDKYRNKGYPSFYCLRHKTWYPSYHNIHIMQLELLYKMTNEKKFCEYKDIFKSDYQ